MTEKQKRRDALWSSFCHWTDNAEATEESEVNIEWSSCACCVEGWGEYIKSCAKCPLYECGYGCFTQAVLCFENDPVGACPYEIVENAHIEDFSMASTDLALLLLLIYYSEGGRR